MNALALWWVSHLSLVSSLFSLLSSLFLSFIFSLLASLLSSLVFLCLFSLSLSVSVFVWCYVLCCVWCCVWECMWCLWCGLWCVSLWPWLWLWCVWCGVARWKLPCVDSSRPHAHMCFNMCAWCRYTRRRLESRHGDAHLISKPESLWWTEHIRFGRWNDSENEKLRET